MAQMECTLVLKKLKKSAPLQDETCRDAHAKDFVNNKGLLHHHFLDRYCAVGKGMANDVHTLLW